MRRPALLRDAIAIGFGLALAPAEAETWPTRPMTMVVPVAAGGTAGIWGLAADTDGVDGAEDIAGAIFTPDTLARARAKSRDPRAMLDDNDGHSFFEMLGDSLVTGPTRTNVNDFRATLIAP